VGRKERLGVALGTEALGVGDGKEPTNHARWQSTSSACLLLRLSCLCGSTRSTRTRQASAWPQSGASAQASPSPLHTHTHTRPHAHTCPHLCLKQLARVRALPVVEAGMEVYIENVANHRCHLEVRRCAFEGALKLVDVQRGLPVAAAHAEG